MKRLNDTAREKMAAHGIMSVVDNAYDSMRENGFPTDCDEREEIFRSLLCLDSAIESILDSGVGADYLPESPWDAEERLRGDKKFWAMLTAGIREASCPLFD